MSNTDNTIDLEQLGRGVLLLAKLKEQEEKDDPEAPRPSGAFRRAHQAYHEWVRQNDEAYLLAAWKFLQLREKWEDNDVGESAWLEFCQDFDWHGGECK